MLVGVQAHALRVDRHVREIDTRILRPLDGAPVRPTAELAVLH